MKRFLVSLIAGLWATTAHATCNSGQPGATIQTQSTPAVVTQQFEVTQSANGNCESVVFVGGGGTLAEGVTFSGTIGNAILGRAQNGERAAVSNGQTIAPAMDLYGKLIISPWANRESMIRGSVSTATNTATSLIPTQGVGIKIYVASAQCFRTDAGTSMAFVTFNDSASTDLPLPPSGGSNAVFEIPLVVAANTALTFTPSVALTSVFCNAQGFNGA